MNFEPVIGFEVHVEPTTQSKMFCRCSAQYFGAPPNTITCPICLGLPGALPVPNRVGIEACVKLGIALGCQINERSLFERKHYFYPDLPKGFQISQYKSPFCTNGVLKLNKKSIRVNRVHMEEDTAKLLHQGTETLIDFNRSGVPLIEVVSDPDLRSPDETKEALVKLQQIIRYLNVSFADMEKGTMRCEVNISVRKAGTNVLPPYRVEIKNLNSFRAVEDSIRYEINRQSKALSAGESLNQETRGWDEHKKVTVIQRSKEEAHDYRYFPEPDIPPVLLSKDEIKSIRKSIPELPDDARARFIEQYKLTDADANLLTETKDMADFFDEAATLAPDQIRAVSVWMSGEVRRRLNEKNLTLVSTKLAPAALVELVTFVNDKTITPATAKELLPEMMESGIMPQKLVEQHGVSVVRDTGQLDEVVRKVVEQNAKAVADYKAGKTQALSFLLGQIQRELKGQGDTGRIKKILLQILTHLA
ncbi:MAG: Asp-tRNA(Asn)/Glu-tRNA(Gln) amidotransferase subunit GatB [bacterium]|nr:Asp-tRNA(Asn)/Glu-tRNA(Gln) amidotransferase subunit GatB [bacterium]